MKRPLVQLVVSLTCTLALIACEAAPATSTKTESPSDTAATKAPPPAEWDALAQRLVTQSAGVKENDIVVIAGGSQDLEFLEDLAVQVRKVGGSPLVRVYSDRMDRRMVADVPEKYDQP